MPTPHEVMVVLQEVLDQWNLGHDGQAQHLLDELINAVDSDGSEAGTAFLVGHLDQMSNRMNANLDVESTLLEMINTLRYALDKNAQLKN